MIEDSIMKELNTFHPTLNEMITLCLALWREVTKIPVEVTKVPAEVAKVPAEVTKAPAEVTKVPRRSYQGPRRSCQGPRRYLRVFCINN